MKVRRIPMSKHEVVATHPAFGEVVFLIEAEDAAKAFSIWKQIVYSSRQWIVKSNTAVEASA
jgi:hypothetical protein